MPPPNSGHPTPSSDGRYSRPIKQRKSLTIAAIVVALALLVGGLVWWFVGRSGHSSDAGSAPVPSDQWEEGLDEMWNLDIDAGEEDFLLTTDEYMVVIDVPAIDGGDSDTDDSAQLTSWRISGDGPEQLASVTIDGGGAQTYAILGEHVVATEMIYDANLGHSYNILTGEKEDVPWGEGDTVTIAGESLAIVCGGGTCAGYDAELNQSWEEQADPEVAASLTMKGGLVQSNGNVKAISCHEGPCTVFNLTTGATTESEFEAPAIDEYPAKYFAFAFRDGWEIQYVDADGNHAQAFVRDDGALTHEMDSDEMATATTAFQISNGGSQTIEDIYAMQAGSPEASADHTTLAGSGNQCDTMTINDETEIEAGFNMWGEHGDQCETKGMPIMTASDQGKVVTIGPDLRAGSDSDILALLATEGGEYVWESELASQYTPSASEPGTLSKLSFGRLVSPDRLLTVDVDTNAGASVVTAYQPH